MNYKNIIGEAVANTQQAGCFAAGTLVHTREGLVPIEKIKVGDWVLSKPESGEGELSYKQVTKTYAYKGKTVLYVEFMQRRGGRFFCRGHPESSVLAQR